MQKHNPVARYCIQITTPPLPRHLLRDDVRCAACDDLHRLMHLDPDVREILTREAWCESCNAGDKPEVRSGKDEA